MKKRFWIVVLFFVGVPMLVGAAEFRSGDQVAVGASETVADDLYAGGGLVTSAGVVTGDLYAAGGTVLVSERVGGDAVLVGGTVTVLGIIADDLRVGGGTIVVQGEVLSDVLIGGGVVRIGGRGVGGDVVIGAGDVRIDAPIKGDARIGGGTVYLNAPIAGNVEIDADRLVLGAGADLSGNLLYRSPKELVRESGAQVAGSISYEPRKASRTLGAGSIAAFISIVVLIKFLALFLAALLLSLFLRRYANELVEKAATRPLYEIGRGFIALSVLPAASVLLLVTIIGIPLGILGLLGFAVLLLFAGISAPVVLGSIVHRTLLRRPLYEVSWKTILLGVILYMILAVIPVIGWAVCFLFTLLTLGAIVNIKLSVLKEWR